MLANMNTMPLVHKCWWSSVQRNAGTQTTHDITAPSVHNKVNSTGRVVVFLDEGDVLIGALKDGGAGQLGAEHPEPLIKAVMCMTNLKEP